jgi:hypothetical protein
MVITDAIRDAIRAAIEKSGSSLCFSRSIGVSHTTVSYWLKGRTRKINSNVWQNLLPVISEFLDSSETVSYPCGATAAGNTGLMLRESSASYGGIGRTSVPLLKLADLASFDPQIDPVENIVREKAKATVAFTSPVRGSYFAVEIGRGQSCFFPAGTRLLLRWPDAPGDGDTVLVKLREKNDFLFAVYTRKSGSIVLTPLGDCGRKRIIPKAEFHNVCCWIVSIREAVLLF